MLALNKTSIAIPNSTIEVTMWPGPDVGTDRPTSAFISCVQQKFAWSGEPPIA